MKNKLLKLLLVLLIFSANLYAENLENLNNLNGISKWLSLKKILLTSNKCVIPPDTEIQFKRDNKLVTIGVSVKKCLEKNGEWKINEKEQSIYLKVAQPYINNFFINTYYSFFVDCKIYNEQKYCQIIFFKGKKYIQPKDDAELFGSGKYQVITFE